MTATCVSLLQEWQDTPMFPALLIITFLFFFQNLGLLRFPASSTFAYVDTLLEQNWTKIESPRISLRRVHQQGLLHQKVWILPFDEMWHLGLSPLPESGKCPGLGAVEAHVTTGSSVPATASETATLLKRGRRVAPLFPLGRPFLFEHNSEREVVHVFALPVQGDFPERSHRWFARIVDPVQFIREGYLILNSSAADATESVKEEFCSSDRLSWLIRSVSYAIRRFPLKGLVPKPNPMDDARLDDPICCREDVGVTEDLMMCGMKCNEPVRYNIRSISHKPE